MALREILAKFGFEIEGGEKLKKTEGALDGLVGKVKTFAGLLGGGLIAEGFGEFIKGQIEAGEELSVMAERLGATAEELQKFQYAAGQTGASAEEASTGLRFLNRSLGEAASGNKEASQTFASMGIAIKNADGSTRPALDVFEDFADHIQSAGDQAKATAMATKVLGRGGAALIPLLNKGGEAVRGLYSDFDELGGGMSDEFVESAREVGDSIKRLKVIFVSLKSNLAQTFFPAIRFAIDRLTSWGKSLAGVAKHTTALRSLLFALAASGIILGLYKLFKIVDLTGMTWKSLGTSLLKLGMWGLVIAAVAALYLVFDDLYSLMTGGKSIIGDTLDQMFGVGAASKFVDQLRGAWDTLSTSVSDLLPTLKDVGETLLVAFVDSIPYLIKFVSILVNGVIGGLKVVWGTLKGIGEALGDLAGGNFKQALDDMKKDAGGGVDSAASNWQSIQKAWDAPTPTIDRSAIAGAAPAKGGGAAGGITINNNVSGVSDPKKAADLTAKATRSTLRSEASKNRAAYGAVATATGGGS